MMFINEEKKKLFEGRLEKVLPPLFFFFLVLILLKETREKKIKALEMIRTFK